MKNFNAFALATAWMLMPGVNVMAVDATQEPLDIPRFAESEISINVDGKLDEAIWETVPAYSDNMVVTEPDTLKAPPHQTTTRFLYTEKGVYVGVWNEQPSETLVARLTSRDKNPNRDSISLTFDTSGEGLYGYWFGVNLGDSINDGQVLPERQFSRQWDGAWYGASAVVEDGWTAEYFIPWSVVSMPQAEGKRIMGFYMSRKVAYLDERWAWPALPPTRPKFMQALQPLAFEDVNPGQQYAFFPFASITQNFVEDKTEYKIGGDIFWRPSSNLQLNATLNPDFGQVESDELVVNLSAFETFFPEKRLFFLEGQEVFTTTPRGDTMRRGEPFTLVNTRRIGGAPEDTVAEPILPTDAAISEFDLAQLTELLGAARVTGQYGRLRYGVLAALEDDRTFTATRDNGEQFQVEGSGRDFGVARALYEYNQNGSYRAIGWLGSLVAHPTRDAWVQALDGHYLSSDGAWKWDGQLIFSDVDDQQGYGGFFDLVYTPKRSQRHQFSFDYFDRNLDINDLGFFRRNDSIHFRYSFNLREPNLPNLKNRESEIFLSQEYNHDGRIVRSGIFLKRTWTFLNLSRLTAEFDYFPSRWDDRNSEGNGSFRITKRLIGGLEWKSDTSKPVSYFAKAFHRGEQLGGHNYEAEAGVTLNPSERLTLEFKLGYKNRDGWLIHLRNRDFATYQAEDIRPTISSDYFFTAKQQLRVSMQWVGVKADEQTRYRVPLGDGDLERVNLPPGARAADFAISNMIFQVRYRWELAPLSDLFVVYTRNGNLASPVDSGFGTLFNDTFDNPDIDSLIVKFRYRLGS